MKGKRILIDADGLYHLKQILRQKSTLQGLKQNQVIITPHTGEFCRLMDYESADLKRNFFSLVARAYKQYRFRIILKDAFTFYYNGSFYYFPYANRYLARAGSGDILSGILLSTMAKSADQGLLAGLWRYIHTARKIRNRYGPDAAITRML